MDFLIDVHLPVSLSKFLDKQPGCTSIHINQILQKWHTTDYAICKYANENNLVVVTKDNDFKNSHFINKMPKKVIRVVLGNISNNDLIVIFSQYLHEIKRLTGNEAFYVEVGHNLLLIS